MHYVIVTTYWINVEFSITISTVSCAVTASAVPCTIMGSSVPCGLSVSAEFKSILYLQGYE